jgi:PAS domain S-box-containing protein
MPETILEYTPFLLAHCGRDLRYVYVTKHYAELLGSRAGDMVGKSIVEVVGPQRFAAMRPYIETVLRGQPVEYDAEIDVAGSGVHQCHVSYVPEPGKQNEVVGWIDSIVDVTHRKQAVEEKERLVETLAAKMGIGIWDWEIHTDTVKWTPEMAVMFGLEASAINSGADFRARIHPDDEDDLNARRDAAIKAHQSFQHEFRIIRPNGEIRWMLALGRAVYDDVTREPTRVVGLTADITERKANEEQAERQRKEFTHLMRVATLGGVSGAIAHELSQPLAAILANAQAAQVELAAKSPKLEEVTEILEEIVEEDQRADRVIRQLRKLLKKEERREVRVNLNDLLLSALQLLHSEFVIRKIRVDTDLSPALPAISGSPVELQQVLINLMINAIDAMASTQAPDRKLNITTRRDGAGNAVVSIRDAGPGMPEADLKRIFEPFFTTKNEGLGLGLSICSTIITSHRGEISLQNSSRGGMVATVLLPAA